MDLRKLELCAVALTALLCCFALAWNILLRTGQPLFSISHNIETARHDAQPVQETAPSEPPFRYVDLNSAGAEELETLEGIGPALAERIVAWREEHGPFRRVQELARVKGVSEQLVEKNLGRMIAVTEDST